MKKLILSTITMASLIFTIQAETYMRIRTSDGQVVKYDVEDVEEVYYEEMAGSDFDQGVTVSGKAGDYTYVDLALPSGTKWATYNVGATKPTEYGDYFAWGETKPKDYYSWETYELCKGSYNNMTKYCNDSEYGIVDNKTVLDAEEDAATVNWGSDWRMPTFEEIEELVACCNWEWKEDFQGSGVNGRLGTSKKNGATIFLPAAGHYVDKSLSNVNHDGYYRSSSLCSDNLTVAFYLILFDGNIYGDDYFQRCEGQSVRAVLTDHSTNLSYVDLALESGTKWATYNVGATKPTEYGDSFAWGETSPKETGTSYKWSKSSKMSKYTTDELGDFIVVLEAEDDAATANWGEAWRMPTRAEQDELRKGCYWEWVDDYYGSGVCGYLGTSKKNGASIFLPAADSKGIYWSSSLYKDYHDKAYSLFFFVGHIDFSDSWRYQCASVRPVLR